MDEEETVCFSEPCTQCSSVSWSITDEGHFYCQSCHNVTERTREVMDLDFTQGARISNVSRAPRTKSQEHGHSWAICEGFQFILKEQAEALIRLGVTSDFKDSVLWPIWTLYLQKSGQAFTSAPRRSSPVSLGAESDLSDSDPGLHYTGAASALGSSVSEKGSDWSDRASCSTSVWWRRRRQWRPLGEVMRMSQTLALIHVCVLWSRGCVTLSDLLRLVREGHVPFLNAKELFPERMKLVGKVSHLFHVQSFPSHRLVLQEAQDLVHFLQLPGFPPISREHLLHPLTLSMRYLIDANLPDQLHQWVSRVEELSQQGSAHCTTTENTPVPFPPPYDLQAAALIVVTMKLLFGLDDFTEWDLSNNLQDHRADVFSVRRWYRLLQTALVRAQHREEELQARRQWNSKVSMTHSKIELKRKEISEQIQNSFFRLGSPPPERQSVWRASIFSFCWGVGEGVDGPSLHHQKLTLTHPHWHYWHRPLQSCNPRCCTINHFLSDREYLPHSFLWLLQLFSFLLRVSTKELYDETLNLEKRVFFCRQHKTGVLQEPLEKRE